VKKRRALVWVLVAAGALAAFATVAALLPPPREPIEDDLAALAKKYGLKKADPPAWTRLDHSELDYSAAPTERYVGHAMSVDQYRTLLLESDALLAGGASPPAVRGIGRTVEEDWTLRRTTIYGGRRPSPSACASGGGA
jgi:hypothetical protein